MRTRMRMGTIVALLGCLAVLPAAAEEPGPTGGCEYDHVVYPEGAERCAAGTRVRCIDGAWGDVGICEDGAEQPPVSGGADVVEDG